MHPVGILLIGVLLRVGCLVLAGFRMLGLSLAGGADLFAPHVPALALLYFAISPKPRASAKVHLVISSAMFFSGALADGIELGAWPDSGTLRVVELVLLTLSYAAHVGCTLWKDRDPHLGWLQRL